jgi:LPXTG-site transpeptidase (sortase) family protein
MKTRPRLRFARALALLQWACIALGALLVGAYGLAVTAGEAARRGDLEAFETSFESPDQSLWSESRIRDFAASQGLEVAPPVAVLRIPSLDLAVPVYPDQRELHLNRGVGLVEGSGSPDKGGNAAIAGHRDGFFRVLMNAKMGDVIEVQTRLAVHRYRITSIDIVDKIDNQLLADTEEPTVTLVTCYPFYFVGSAPRRYLVRGTYVWPSELDNHS